MRPLGTRFTSNSSSNRDAADCPGRFASFHPGRKLPAHEAGASPRHADGEVALSGSDIWARPGRAKRWLRARSTTWKAQGPFVVVDCSSLVGPLMESELFGYAKGAFTGAFNQKLGLLDAANGGTAFFDEIGELPLELQMKLLRVLQEKQFRAIGGLAHRSSNFRVVAATNRDLLAEVEAKRFRQDLYYRLNVMRLRLAPLRERRDDIPALVSHFLQRYGNDHRVADEVMDSLVEYDWPGNVRELEHAVQQMVAMNSGPWITVADLPSAVVNRSFERELRRPQSGNIQIRVCHSRQVSTR